MASHVDNEQGKQESTAGLLPTKTPSALPQRPKRANRLSWSSTTLDTWIVEELSMAFSVACLISIYVILLAYNRKPRPNFVYNISLNTIVSIFATDSFEDASRGPLGSIFLLFRHQGRSIASLGAMILIFMLAFDPMVQQILSYPSEPTIVVTDEFEATAPQLQYIELGPSYTDFFRAYYLGIWSTNFNITPSCPSGNCTWPLYRSVGVCSQCSDITSTATLDCPMPTNPHVGEWGSYLEGECKVVLPQGQSSNGSFNLALNKTTGIVIPTSVNFTTDIVWEVASFREGDIPTNQTYSNIQNPLFALAQASLEFDSDRITNPSNLWEGVTIKNVTQCSFSYCIQDYNVSVTNGKANIEKSPPDFGKTSIGSKAESGFTFLCLRPSQRPIDPLVRYMNLNTTEFQFCGQNYEQRLASELLLGSLNTAHYTYNNSRWMPLFTSANYADNFGRILELGLHVIAPQVAASLTLINLQSQGANNISGTVYTNEVIVRVQWLWMILPTLLVILGNVFLAYTMYVSKGKVLWKSSMLALLFHGLNDETAAESNVCITSSKMEKLAEDIHVRLQSSERDEHVMLLHEK